MRRTRGVLLGLIAATLIAASAAPAGATVFSNVGIYYNAVYGGDNQCAWYGNYFSNQDPGASLVAQANTATTHSTGCGTAFGLPSGWMTSQVVVQRWAWNGSAWVWSNAYSSGTATNANGGNNAFSYVNVNPTPALYRNVTGHNAITAGAWRGYLYASNSILFP